MLHVLQSLSDGSTTVIDAPIPGASGAQLVVRSRASVVSAGTERMLVGFGRASLIEKARQQPDKVRQVLDKVRTDGLAPTLEAVRSKLGTPISLGYCQAGIVTEVGSRVRGFSVGDRVATNGPHSEYVRVPHTLAARIPDGVSFEAAAFTPLAAIGLQGLRLAEPTLGETVVVFGLGLIGLLTVQLARANGCRVIGIDTSPDRLAVAKSCGAEVVAGGAGVDVAESVLALTGGLGADVVLLTLASDSDDPVHAAATMARKRGRLVLVGTTGLALRRDDFYRKELSLQVSCSYGPGRYDPLHEEQGVDYPAAFVRWTEARNFEAVLGLMASGAVNPLPLITHRIPIADAAKAYDVVAGKEASLAIVLDYPERTNGDGPGRTLVLGNRAPATGRGAVAFVGAGNFASRMLIPAFVAAGATLEVISSSGGVSAATVGRKFGFRVATTDSALAMQDAAVDTVAITTRHDSHASLTVQAMDAGKHVFVEKPLATTLDDVDRIEQAHARAGTLLCVGFNRRYAPLVRKALDTMKGRSGPVALSITVNAGKIPRDHWVHDAHLGGGRVLGEGTHFIDLARFLTGAAITGIQVTTAASGVAVLDDIALLQVAFADGSVASIQYLANGHPSFPKERIEAFYDGRALRIDNYRKLEAWGIDGVATRWPVSQDKGHRALTAAFVAAVRGAGPAPIPAAELFEVARWSVRAGIAASAGGGAA